MTMINTGIKKGFQSNHPLLSESCCERFILIMYKDCDRRCAVLECLELILCAREIVDLMRRNWLTFEA